MNEWNLHAVIVVHWYTTSTIYAPHVLRAKLKMCMTDVTIDDHINISLPIGTCFNKRG